MNSICMFHAYPYHGYGTLLGCKSRILHVYSHNTTHSTLKNRCHSIFYQNILSLEIISDFSLFIQRQFKERRFLISLITIKISMLNFKISYRPYIGSQNDSLGSN